MRDDSMMRLVMINGGSSTVKVGIYTADDRPKLLLKAKVERIGEEHPVLTVSPADEAPGYSRDVEARDHRSAADALADWLEQDGHTPVRGVGHRVVHGGIHLRAHQLVTRELVDELRRSQYLDLAHLPREIALIEAFQARLPGIPQVACFDTAFHRDLPSVAQLLPIPREFIERGVRRLGFHGLSYTFLMQALRKVAGAEAADGRVILAHLGSGASMVALQGGRPVDTTMAFTPAAGLMMGTRPGDLDPGLIIYMMRIEKLTPEQMDDFISRQCGLAGVSGGTSDIRQLESRQASDAASAEAIDLFCYSAKKWIGAYFAVLGGLDTLVFSGGIGEHSPSIRERICRGLDALGIAVDSDRNAQSAAVISKDRSRVTVRVIPTDEEAVMAEIVTALINNNQTLKDTGGLNGRSANED
jgi:acetate kinase